MLENLINVNKKYLSLHLVKKLKTLEELSQPDRVNTIKEDLEKRRNR